MCSFDARSKGQPWPLPLREGIRIRTALPVASMEDSLSRPWLIALKKQRQADQNAHPTKPQPKVTPQAYPLGRTVRRIRSTMSVRAAELVRSRVPVEDGAEVRTPLESVFTILRIKG
jgi:hypothetical protein